MILWFNFNFNRFRNQLIGGSWVITFFIGVNLAPTIFLTSCNNKASAERNYWFNFEFTIVDRWVVNICQVGTIGLTNNYFSNLSAHYKHSIMHPWMAWIFCANISVFVVHLSVLRFKCALFDSIKFVCVIACYNHTIAGMRVEWYLEIVFWFYITFLCEWGWDSCDSNIYSRYYSLFFEIPLN